MTKNYLEWKNPYADIFGIEERVKNKYILKIFVGKKVNSIENWGANFLWELELLRKIDQKKRESF